MMEKNNKKYYIIVGSIALLGLIFALLILANFVKSCSKETENAMSALNKERNSKKDYINLSDSLKTANKELSTYKTLTMSMIHRDNSTEDLTFKIGSAAYLKLDSSRVIIEDVLIGGGKYNYYVKYRVLLGDNTIKEISPELIFK